MLNTLILPLVDVLNMSLVLIGLSITVADVGLPLSCQPQDSVIWESTDFIRYNKWLPS